MQILTWFIVLVILHLNSVFLRINSQFVLCNRWQFNLDRKYFDSKNDLWLLAIILAHGWIKSEFKNQDNFFFIKNSWLSFRKVLRRQLRKLAIYNGIIGKAFKMINFDWLWTIKYKMSIKCSVTLDHSIYIPIYFLINFFFALHIMNMQGKKNVINSDWCGSNERRTGVLIRVQW